MLKENCRNCAALIDGDDGEGICDETQKNVERLECCPEVNKNER